MLTISSAEWRQKLTASICPLSFFSKMWQQTPKIKYARLMKWNGGKTAKKTRRAKTPMLIINYTLSKNRSPTRHGSLWIEFICNDKSVVWWTSTAPRFCSEKSDKNLTWLEAFLTFFSFLPVSFVQNLLTLHSISRRGRARLSSNWW